jgi:hypothetical protein
MVSLRFYVAAANCVVRGEAGTRRRIGVEPRTRRLTAEGGDFASFVSKQECNTESTEFTRGSTEEEFWRFVRSAATQFDTSLI